MMNKSRISVQGLNPEVIEQFKAIVKNKYGKLNTVYGLELQKALEMYISASKIPQGSTHTHKETEDKANVPLEQKKLPIAKFETVKEEFLNNAGDTETFQRLYAERLVKEHLGRDPRTVEKYCSELKDIWMLK
jgi:hypothetical protein